jgi:hypothetical protein
MKKSEIYKAYVCPRCGGTFHHKNHLFKCKGKAAPETKPQQQQVTETPTNWVQPAEERQQAEVVIQKPQPSTITVIQAEEVSKEDVVAPIGQPTEEATEQPTAQETEEKEEEEGLCPTCGQSLKKIPSTWDKDTLGILASLPYDIAGMIVHPCFEMTEKEQKVAAKCLKLMCDKRFPITKESKEDIISVVGAFGGITTKKIMMYRKIKEIETTAARARKAAENEQQTAEKGT